MKQKEAQRLSEGGQKCVVYMYVFVFAHMHVCARTLFSLKQVKKMAFICPLCVRRGYCVCMCVCVYVQRDC